MRMAWSAMSVVKWYGRAVLVGLRRFDPFLVLDQRRMELVGVAADEAVEVVEAQAVGPAIERADEAGFPVGDVVVLAEPGVRVAVLAEHLGERRRRRRDDARVAGEAGPRLADDAAADRVMIAPGQAGRPAWGCTGPWCGTACTRRPLLATRSIVGVGMPPPKVPNWP